MQKRDTIAVTSPNGVAYNLTAKSEQEANEWLQAIQRSIDKGEQKRKEKDEDIIRAGYVILHDSYIFFLPLEI